MSMTNTMLRLTTKRRPSRLPRGAFRAVLVVMTAALSAGTAYAQPAAPDEPPPVWSGSGGAGISVTSGNSETSNYNLTFDLTHDPASPNLMKWKALYLRGEQDGTVAVDRTSLGFRDEYTLSGRTFLFGQVDYLRDTFKAIDYLVAPTAGIGYKVLDTEPTKFSVDVGVGGVWEKNPGVDVDSSGALTAGEQFTHQLNPAVGLTHAATGLWKMDDFGDSLYTISVGVAASLAEHLQLTIDLLDSYKNQPPTPATKKNDVAVVTAIAVKY